MSHGDPVSLAIANCGYDGALDDPEAVLGRYDTLVGWAQAVAEAGAAAVTVVQRFWRDVVVARDGIEYRFVADGPRGPAGAWFRGDRMARAIGALAPDAIHVNGCTFPLFVRNLRRRLPAAAAIVVQDHTGSGTQHLPRGWRGTFWRRFHRFGLGAADAFLFTAREQAALWSRAGIIQDDQDVYEIPEASTNLGRAGVGPGPDRPLPGRPALLSVARLDANKDPLTLLAGFERAAAALPGAALTLAFGGDALLPEVRARIASSAVLAARVHLRGALARSDLPAIYRGADLFLMASHREGASFALIEALSFGLLPIVTDIPPLRALTDGGRLGALFPPGDSEALARAIVRLGREDLFALRQQVLGYFARELSWPAIGRRAVAAYAATTDRRRGDAAAR